MQSPPAPQKYSTDVSKALRASENRYRRLFETAQDGILLLNADTAQIEDVNPYLIDMLGYSHAEFLGKKLWEVGSFADRAESKEMFAELQTKGYVRYEDLPLKTKSGAQVEVEFVSNTYDSEGIKVIQCNIRDITKRKAVEALHKRHTQLYAALSQCNKAIVHCVSEETLFLQVCRAAVQFGGMKLAWIGLVDVETRKVRPVASFGDDTGYLKDINISVDADSPFGHGPTGTAIREDRLYWCQDFLNDPVTIPWRERAVSAGLAATAVLPLHREGITIGAFTLYSVEPNAFDEAARDLLVEMATDISFALGNFAREAHRQRAKQEIEFKNTILQTQQEASLDAMLVVDENGKIISYNQQFIDLWRLSPQLVSARLDAPVLQSVADQVENPDAFVARVQYLNVHHNDKSREELKLKDGRIIDRYSSSMTGADGKYYGRVWYFRDITERRQAEQSLRIAATAFEVQESIMITDVHNVILRVNQSFTRLTGYSAEEAIGQTPTLIKSGMQDAGFYQQMWTALNRDRSWQGEMWNRRKNGEVHPVWQTISAVTNNEGEITHYVGVSADLSQYKKDEAAIHSLAFYDPLTSLPNRRLLLDRLQHVFAASSRNHNHGALLYIDLDNFKTLNDTKGHNIGDLLLVEVAGRLHACVREADTVARVGGDEFVVLLEDLSEDPLQAAAQTDVVCDQILTAFRKTYSLRGHEYYGSASIGVSLFRNQDVTVNEILKRADAAMYQAKSAGRNTLRFYDPTLQAVLEARTELESDLRSALEGNQFRLYYQAQVDHTGLIFGAEALIRWQHPQRGLVPPMEFIQLAEEIGLILPIGQWVLETACAQLKTWEVDPLTRNLQLAVNVSAHQFHQPDFVEQVCQTLRIHAFTPGLLKLELTESLVLDNIDDAIDKMLALREVGVRFSMDDFGTGYSSLSYLTKLPLDQLKIDQSFVRNIGVKHSDAVIVQTIIGMANNLGMEVIAEGVETENQRAFLEQHGCALCQGFLFGKPVPIEAFDAKLRSM